MVLRFFLLFFFITTTLGADEISALISKIHHAKSSQKRLLINELKLKLKGVNASKRDEAIQNLRKNMHINHQEIHSHIPIHQTTTSHRVEIPSSNHQMNKHGHR